MSADAQLQPERRAFDDAQQEIVARVREPESSDEHSSSGPSRSSLNVFTVPRQGRAAFRFSRGRRTGSAREILAVPCRACVVSLLAAAGSRYVVRARGAGRRPRRQTRSRSSPESCCSRSPAPRAKGAGSSWSGAREDTDDSSASRNLRSFSARDNEEEGRYGQGERRGDQECVRTRRPRRSTAHLLRARSRLVFTPCARRDSRSLWLKGGRRPARRFALDFCKKKRV